MQKKNKNSVLRRLIMAALCSGVFCTGINPAAAAENTAIAIENAGFERTLPDGSPAAWSSQGDVHAVSISADGYEGKRSLLQKSNRDYKVYTSQTLANLDEGYYTLTAWIKSSGGQSSCYLSAKDFGASEAKAAVPAKEGWTLVTLRGIHVTEGQCTIGLYSDAEAGNWVQLDNMQLVKDDQPYTLLKGGDISELTFVEDKGGKFYDADGVQKDCLQILKENGMNFARLRLYNDPGKGRGDGSYYCPEGYLDEADILNLARRAKEKDFTLQLSFHYSDYWTNGACQFIPAEWQKQIEGLDEQAAVDVLEKCVYDYTKKMLLAMNAQGTSPEYVSLGNEIQSGMLFPYGKAAEDTWQNLARFFNAGAKAVREVCPGAKIILHLDDAGNYWKYDNFFGHCRDLNVDYDIIGTSYYPFFTQKSAAEIGEFCRVESDKFGKPVIFMETGFSWSPTVPNGQPGQLPNNGPYEMTKEAQKQFMQDVFNEMKNVPGGRVLGDLYWDPIMIEHPGIGWAMMEKNDEADVNVVSNTTLFDFDGRALPVFDAYRDNTEGSRGGIVSGIVTGENGRQIANAAVELYADSGTVYKSKTDKYGGYMFLNVPDGENYKLKFSADGYGSASGTAGSVQDGAVIKPAAARLSGVSLSGRVADEYGVPLSDAQVTVQLKNKSYAVKSDADGFFTVKDLPAGVSGSVSVSCRGYADANAWMAGINPGGRGAQDFSLVQNSGTIKGSVHNEMGGPVADVCVEAVNAAGQSFSALTDDRGRYEITKVTAGSGYTVAAERAGFIDKTFARPVSVGIRSVTGDVSFVMKKNLFSLSGTVYDEHGNPLSNAKVWADSGDKSYSVLTQADGSYRFNKLLAGREYEVSAYYGDKPAPVLSGVYGAPGDEIRRKDLTFPINIPLNNPGFEQWGSGRFDIVGWQVSGTKDSVVVQGQASHSGRMEMATWLDKAYTSDISQAVKDLPAGKYTMTAYIMNGSGDNESYMYIIDANGDKHRCSVPLSPTGWTPIRLTVDLPGGDATVGFYTDAKASDWMCIDDVSFVRHND